jgi:hypothetical protein
MTNTTETDEYDFNIFSLEDGEISIRAHQLTTMHLEGDYLLGFSGKKEIGERLDFSTHDATIIDADATGYLLSLCGEDDAYVDLDYWLGSIEETDSTGAMPAILASWRAKLKTYEIDVKEGW